MNKEDISPLVQRYMSASESGKEPYFDADEFAEMLDSFDEADDEELFNDILALGLKLHPDCVELQIKQCQHYIFIEEYDSALVLIEAIGDFENLDLDEAKLECYGMLDQFDKLKKHLELLIKRNCDYLESLLEFAVPLLNDLGLEEDAREYIDRGLVMFPKSTTLREELAYCMEANGELEAAIKIFNELIDENPYSFNNWFTLGRLHSFNKEYDKAIEAFDFALTCNDANMDLKILKAYCYYMNENYDKALELYNEILNTQQSSPHKQMFMNYRIYSLMAECYLKVENYEEGYNVLKELINSNLPLETITYIDYLRCCVETDREKEASDTLLKAVKANPNDVKLLSLLAMTYVENEEEGLAIETTERLFDLIDSMKHPTSEDYDSLLHAGKYLLMKGDEDNALKYFNKVLEGRPTTPFIHIHIALAYLSKDDMENFAKHFSRSTTKDLMNFLAKTSATLSEVEKQLYSRNIPPEDLAKEFLNNKDNNN